MLTLALELKTLLIAPHIVDTLVPLVFPTADKVLTPRFYRDPDKHPMGDNDKLIDVTSCLSLLHITALGCMSDIEHITRFWRLVPLGLVLGCLSQNQLPQDFELMLKILSTSVLKDSFGPIIVHDSQQQDLYAMYIIDRLGYPLYERPYQADSDQRMELDVVLKMRLEILPLLMGMTRSPFASAALALHPTFIARLVCLISDGLDVLYDRRSDHELR
jgi:hypothetical protein